MKTHSRTIFVYIICLIGMSDTVSDGAAFENVNSDYFKFTVVYCESVNLIGYITDFYLLIETSYASVHIARNV